RQHLVWLECALSVLNIGHRLAVVETKTLGELILRPALGLARRLDAVADQLLRDFFEHGSHLLNQHFIIAKLKKQDFLAYMYSQGVQLPYVAIRFGRSGSLSLTVAIPRSRHEEHRTRISLGDERQRPCWR